MSAFTGSLPDGILAAYIVSPSAIVPTGLMHLAYAFRVIEAILPISAFENSAFVIIAPIVVFPVNGSFGSILWSAAVMLSAKPERSGLWNPAIFSPVLGLKMSPSALTTTMAVSVSFPTLTECIPRPDFCA